MLLLNAHAMFWGAVAAFHFSADLREQLSVERFLLVVALTQKIPETLHEYPEVQKHVLVLDKHQLKLTYGDTLHWLCAPRKFENHVRVCRSCAGGSDRLKCPKESEALLLVA
jgi:hypothetical protein